MDSKHDEMAEALMHRRKGFADKHHDAHNPPPVAPGHSANHGKEEAPASAVSEMNRGNGEEAPQGASPQGMHTIPGAQPGDAQQMTPEMIAELLGSHNAGGLRGRVIAAAQAKKC